MNAALVKSTLLACMRAHHTTKQRQTQRACDRALVVWRCKGEKKKTGFQRLSQRENILETFRTF